MDRGPDWYRGDCHVHSVHSDGELTPEQLTAEALAAGLDFLATTEHNTAAAHGAWDCARKAGLHVVVGEEVTTWTGHWLALGIEPGQVVDWQYGVREDVIGRHLAEARRAGGVCVAAHPHAPYPSGDFMFPLEYFDLVEVWNGLWRSDRPWNADNEAAVAEWGRRLAVDVQATGGFQPAIGNSDAHLPGQLGTPQTVVFAPSPRTPDLLAALRSGRSWIAESAAVGLEFTAEADGRSAGVGETLVTRGATATVRVAVTGVPEATVRLHTDRGKVHHGGPATRWTTTAEESLFVRAEIRHPDGRMAALTNPIVLTP
ncbi:histidinol phosphatase [Streptacidiphilus pinicola]|uniref:Histidinol phosphatase n=1 Tax=Streptacidiphilus pinicola TaxID=2219663 RepID=A0A2X0IEK5_9ACTN|nr:CehA/McbA family metallohydrolase [Streptacidiphilus pinicola]RAG83452.1 histidinol phosphatase [Streptacidiphilus pinicola]